jgi:hypothetical protein
MRDKAVLRVLVQGIAFFTLIFILRAYKLLTTRAGVIGGLGTNNESLDFK